MSRDKGKGFDLRKSLRLSVSLPVKFKLFDIATRKTHPVIVNAQTRNISRDGLCLETNTTKVDNREIFLSCLKGEKQLQMKLEIPDVGPPLQLRGKVLWYSGKQPGSPYQFSIGMFITEATDNDRNRWKKFVEERKGKSIKRTWWHKIWAKISPKDK